MQQTNHQTPPNPGCGHLQIARGPSRTQSLENEKEGTGARRYFLQASVE